MRDRWVGSFDGLRVVDLTAFWAGPLVTHVLGMLGAEVIHVESTTRPDGTRMLAGLSFKEPEWWEQSGIFSGLNTNKKSRHAGSATTARQGAAPATHRQRRCGRRKLHAPRRWTNSVSISRVTTSSWCGCRASGSTDRGATTPAFAFVIEDASGLTWRTGYPDRNPLSPYCLGDPNAGLHALAGLLRALAHRAATGHGMTVEAAMVDAALNVAAEQIVEYAENGVVLERTGNQDPSALLQDVFAADGDDAWVAIIGDERGTARRAVDRRRRRPRRLVRDARRPTRSSKRCGTSGCPSLGCCNRTSKVTCHP